jgi:prevent-host-death family protein
MRKEVEQIAAGEFKAKCLQLMDKVQKGRQEIVITKRGKPVARLVPCDEELPGLFGCMKGSVKTYGNIIEPIEDEWESNA